MVIFTPNDGGPITEVEIDEENHGRVIKLSAFIIIDDIRGGRPASDRARRYVRNHGYWHPGGGNDNDHAGHIIPNCLGGDGSVLWNIIPQNPLYNQSVQNRIDRALLSEIESRGKSVSIDFFAYYQGDSARPYQYDYHIEIYDRDNVLVTQDLITVPNPLGRNGNHDSGRNFSRTKTQQASCRDCGLKKWWHDQDQDQGGGATGNAWKRQKKTQGTKSHSENSGAVNQANANSVQKTSDKRTGDTLESILSFAAYLVPIYGPLKLASGAVVDFKNKHWWMGAGKSALFGIFVIKDVYLGYTVVKYVGWIKSRSGAVEKPTSVTPTIPTGPLIIRGVNGNSPVKNISTNPRFTEIEVGPTRPPPRFTEEVPTPPSREFKGWWARNDTGGRYGGRYGGRTKDDTGRWFGGWFGGRTEDDTGGWFGGRTEDDTGGWFGGRTKEYSGGIREIGFKPLDGLDLIPIAGSLKVGYEAAKEFKHGNVLMGLTKTVLCGVSVTGDVLLLGNGSLLSGGVKATVKSVPTIVRRAGWLIGVLARNLGRD